MSRFDDGQLARVKDLLRPLLMRRRYVMYESYPLRIIPDPGTAFRRVPPGEPLPELLPPAALYE